MRVRTAPMPIATERVRQRFERWRRTRTPGRSPIPDALWAAAVALARQHGLYATSQLLRLDYTALKKRMPAGDETVAPAHGSPTFVELTPAPGPCAACVIEIEGPCGGRMRVQLPGVTFPDLVALTRMVWSGAA
jgi:hypothetical protein